MKKLIVSMLCMTSCVTLNSKRTSQDCMDEITPKIVKYMLNDGCVTVSDATNRSNIGYPIYAAALKCDDSTMKMMIIRSPVDQDAEDASKEIGAKKIFECRAEDRWGGAVVEEVSGIVVEDNLEI